jgi:hypothetical protein
MKLIRKFVPILLLSFIFLGASPTFTNAEEIGTNTSNNTEIGTNTSNNTEVGTSTSSAPRIKLVNPLGSTKTLPELIDGILRIVLTIGIPLIALMIIYSGFKFVMAQGNPKELEEARRNLLYVLIGAGILLGAYVIAEAVVGTINAIRN